MPKIIKITESQEKMAIKALLEDYLPINPSQVLIVKDYLDRNFQKGEIEEIGGINGGETDGLISYRPVVGAKDKNGKVFKNLTDVQLYDLLFERFKNMIGDKDKRKRFLIQVIKDWYSNKITKDGMLSVMYC